MIVSRLLPLAATAAVTLRSLLAERSLGVALALVLAALATGVLVASASVGLAGRLEADLSWVAAEGLGWLLAITHGAGLAGRSGALGSAALARPVAPGLLLAGRFLGVAAGLLLYSALVTLILAAWLWGWRGGAAAPVVGSGLLLALRLLVILAVGTFFLALARPGIAASLATVVGIAGWLGSAATTSANGAAGPSLLRPVTWLAGVALPDLPALAPPIAGLPVTFAELPEALLRPTAYALLYTTAVVAAALTAFPARLRRGRAPFD